MGAAMAADVVVSRELKSLQDELSITQRERLAAPATAPPTMPSSSVEQVNESQDECELRDQLHELANEVTGFFTEAEKSISAHPTQSVIGGAMLVGILIGRLLGRR
jgi:ElaB/YqjD/DUF883 family membrane-anchored ribosome-binding protein